MSERPVECKLRSSGSQLPGHIRFDCCLDAAMSVIEGRWKGTILCMLHGNGGMRFSELQKSIGQVSSRILSKQLKELEEDGMISRTVGSDRKLKVTYSLTDKGRSILPTLQMLAEWGSYHQMIQVILPEIVSPLDDLDENASRSGTVELAKEDPLPGTEDRLSARDYESDGRADAARPQMRVRVPFRVEVVVPLRERTCQAVQHVGLDVRVRVLIDGDARSRVHGEDHADPLLDAAGPDRLPDSSGYVDHLGPFRGHSELGDVAHGTRHIVHGLSYYPECREWHDPQATVYEGRFQSVRRRQWHTG